MKKECSDLVASYLSWLKDKIKVTELDGGCEISTPFLDRHNDHLVIYVEKTPSGLRLTDDKYIISDLEMCGCKLDTPQRKKMLEVILNGHGVHEQDGELFVESSSADFPRKKHALVQAMLQVNDLFAVAKPNVLKMFLDDVGRFLEAHEIRYAPNVDFQGKSGFTHKFDFLIPRSRSNPERIIRAINRPDKNHTTAFLFAWNDVKEVRPEGAVAYAMLNDSEKEVSPDVIGAFRQYNIEPILWSQREQIASELAA